MITSISLHSFDFLVCSNLIFLFLLVLIPRKQNDFQGIEWLSVQYQTIGLNYTNLMSYYDIIRFAFSVQRDQKEQEMKHYTQTIYSRWIDEPIWHEEATPIVRTGKQTDESTIHFIFSHCHFLLGRFKHSIFTPSIIQF